MPRSLIVFGGALIFLAGCASLAPMTLPERDTLYQVSTLGALQQGLYQGGMTYGQLEQHGDFGVGTFDALDGEMVATDGKFYQVTSDGVAHRVQDSATAPFAAITFFDADKTITLDQSVDFQGLGDFLDKQLPTKNIFYAIKTVGTFEYIKTRSVPRQKEPYPPLAEVVKTQPTFEFNNVQGTLVGLRSPDYVAGLNQPGYHFHFITADEKSGGHVLEMKLHGVTIALDETRNWETVLPNVPAFNSATFSAPK
ncbi:MAG TPA: acetolactate decarboxylase [Anaerolineae bacterium]|nr:acetolactate decarboxylase [Anaerolineae bacterium]